MVETVKAAEARQHWSDLLNRIYRTRARVVVEKSGIPIAAIIPFADLESLQRYEAKRAERFKILDEIREAFADVPEEEIERETAKALAEVRAEMQAGRERAAAKAAAT